MIGQRHQTSSLEQRLTEEALRLRKQVHGTPPGVEREQLNPQGAANGSGRTFE